ncbi:class I adenylate-forming enzyme family protein [Pseudomonas sp. A-R-19]|uniref:class I adenylate-forming enzyme family protein n=1 Tax=Pseudomonas sp. A-R-19 TaxID=2832403 RepID=UPI001CBF595A|nr:AMP-binding protein [Pseudomonas sp. A-R-19]
MSEQPFTAPTLYGALSQSAMARPDSIALIYEGESITYAELMRRVDSVAEYLHGLGLRGGQTIAAFSQNRPEFVIFFYAAAKLGIVFVPLNFNLTALEVTYVLNHCEAKYLFRDDAAAASMDLDVPSVQLETLCIPEVSSEPASLPRDVDVDADSDVVIAYTSGSTGNPKAVAISHRATLNAALSLIELWGLSDKDTTVVAAPLGFLLGLSTATTVGLLAGMKVVINRRFHPAEVLDAFIEHQATIYNGVPTMFSMMLEYSEQQGKDYDLSGVRALICSGAPMPDELLNRFARRFQKPLQNYYGMTECYPLIGKYASDAVPFPSGAVGRIAPGANISVVGPQGQSCAPGEEGELLAQAPSTLTRYHKDPDLTQLAFTNGWFKTGDLGYIDERGYVFITGRLKEIIIRGGANISPVEVENTLLRHPEVVAAAVLGVPDKTYGEVPVAYVVRRAGSELSEASVITHAEKELAKFKVPAAITFCPELPLGKTGKVDKAQLRKLWDQAEGLPATA